MTTEAICMKLKEAGITEILAYSRKSRDIDGEGLRKHRDVMTTFAKMLGFPIRFYEEVGSSETLDRPMLNKLNDEISHRSSSKCVVVYRLDRLSRKVTDMERLLNDFKFNDVILIEAHRERIVDYNDVIGTKLEAVMSDLYLTEAKKVLNAGRRKAISLYGFHQGISPLGYRYNRISKKLEPNEDAWAIKEIFSLYLEGHCTHTIAVMMNELGVKSGAPRGDGNMIASTVHRILSNEKYKGWQIYGKKAYDKDKDGKSRCKPRPKEEWLIYEGAHEPIIDPDMFNLVQEQMHQRKKTPSVSKRRKFALTHVVKCSKCGKRMSYIGAGTGTYKTDTIRTCLAADYSKSGERCGNKGMPAPAVEEFVKQKLFTEVWQIIKSARQLISDENELNLSTIKNENLELKEKQKERSKIEDQIANTVDAIADFGKSERLLVKLKQLESRLELVENEIAQLDSGVQKESFAWIELFMEQTNELISQKDFEKLKPEEKNLFITKFIDYVEVTDGQIVGIQYQMPVERLKTLLF